MSIVEAGGSAPTGAAQAPLPMSIVEAGESAPTGAAQAPLPDDISLARVASIVDAGGGNVCASTKSQYKSAKTKYWTQFCKESLWDATEKLKLVDDRGRVNDGTIRQFFIWLDNLPGMTFHPMKNCKQWLQKEYELQMAKKKKPWTKAYVGHIACVKEIFDKWSNGHGEQVRLDFKDMQASFEDDFSPAQMIEIVQRLRDPRSVMRMSPLYRLMTLLEIRLEYQQCARGDDLRGVTLGHLFCRHLPSLGIEGPNALFQFSNGSKTNKAGRIEFTGSAPWTTPASVSTISGASFGTRTAIRKRSRTSSTCR
mmetsp:Transcript_9128/g.32123  ORF Transcript_9128/g.32123 Transcript_9128/m.32123 type:complete len:310 (-) Transcript_9128:660-1589(-)